MANPFLVIGGIATGLVVAAFGAIMVPGWVASAQDAAAIKDLGSIRHAQSVAKDVEGGYIATIDGLKAGEWGVDLKLSGGVTLDSLTATDNSWCAAVKSATGKYFAAANNQLTPVSGATVDEVVTAGCPIGPASTPPVVTVAASGGNLQASASAVTCDVGAPQYRLRSRSTNTAEDGAWGTYSTWGTTRVATVPTAAGTLFGFQAEARCSDGMRSSTPASSAEVPLLTDIPTPAAPVVAVAQDGTTQHRWTGTTVCAPGTTPRYLTRDFRDDADGWLGWDTTPTTLASKPRTTSDQGYEYITTMRAQCVTGRAASGWSDESNQASYIRPVVPPTAPTVFQVGVNGAGQRYYSWNTGSCTGGTIRQTRVMTHQQYWLRDPFGTPYQGSSWGSNPWWETISGLDSAAQTAEWQKATPRPGSFKEDAAWAKWTSYSPGVTLTGESTTFVRSYTQAQCINTVTGRSAAHDLVLTPAYRP